MTVSQTVSDEFLGDPKTESGRQRAWENWLKRVAEDTHAARLAAERAEAEARAARSAAEEAKTEQRTRDTKFRSAFNRIWRAVEAAVGEWMK